MSASSTGTSASLSRKVARTSIRASVVARAKWRSSVSVGASAQWTSSMISSSERRRAAFARTSEIAVCRRWRSVSGSAAIGGGRPLTRVAEVRQQARQLTARRAEILAQELLIGAADELLECIGDRSVGRVDHGVAGAVEDEHPIVRDLVRELADQTALARPGLTTEQRDPPPLAGRPGNQRPQPGQLRQPPDERCRGRQPERTGKCVFGHPSANDQI